VKTARRGERGQAAAEYIAIVGAVLIALGSLSAVAKHQCVKDMTGALADCETLPGAVSAAFRSSIEEITFLINLPF
jgi:hypothetical protein